MVRKEYANLTLTKPIVLEYLERRKKKEHRSSISETAQAILIESLGIPENEL